MTNLERIKSMSAKEFAAFINQIKQSCFVERICTNCPLLHSGGLICSDALESWLEAEVTK